MKKWVLLLFVGMMFGCISQLTTDPNTGQTEQTYSLDPNAVAKYETGAQGAVGLLGALSLLYPVLTPIAAAAAGIYATWLKVKPKIMEETKKSEVSYNAGATLAYALDQIHRDNPEVWTKVIAPVLDKAKKPFGEIDNAIRGFRGLPVEK
jgi:hypothetical protein